MLAYSCVFMALLSGSAQPGKFPTSNLFWKLPELIAKGDEQFRSVYFHGKSKKTNQILTKLPE